MSHFALPVSDAMQSPVRTITEDAKVTDADAVLRNYAFSSLAVLDSEGRLVGVVSRTDLLRAGRARAPFGKRHPLLTLPADLRVRDVMRRGVITVAPETAVREASRIMVAERIHRVFVTRRDELLGVFSTKDVMDVVARSRSPRPIAELMSVPMLSVDAEATIEEATDRLSDAHVSGLVVTEDERPIGTFTQTEALQARGLPASTRVDEVMSYAMLCLDLKTPVHRAAAHAAATRARRIIVVEFRTAIGVLTGIDFARAAT